MMTDGSWLMRCRFTISRYIGTSSATGGIAISAIFERKSDSRPWARLKTMANAAMIEITVDTSTATAVAMRLLRIQVSTGQSRNTDAKFDSVGWTGRPVGCSV